MSEAPSTIIGATGYFLHTDNRRPSTPPPLMKYAPRCLFCEWVYLRKFRTTCDIIPLVYFTPFILSCVCFIRILPSRAWPSPITTHSRDQTKWGLTINKYIGYNLLITSIVLPITLLFRIPSSPHSSTTITCGSLRRQQHVTLRQW